MPGRGTEKLVPLGEVQRLALSRAHSLPAVEVAVDDGLGCVLATDVSAPEDVPPFANTAMDGYALRSADTAGAPVELEVIGVLGAGMAPDLTVGPGQAIQIMTGAAIPGGADAVAIVERTQAVTVDATDSGIDTGAGRTGTADGRPGSSRRLVRVLDQVSSGAHVRPAGSDLARGTIAVGAGTVLAPAHIGVLASVGAGRIRVIPRPRVGVMITGDEIVGLNPDGSAPPLAPGQIRDSNRHAMVATLRRDGFEAIDLGVALDTEEAVEAGLGRALRRCDAVLTTGGVSKGEFDYVKVVLARLASREPAVAAGASVHELGVAIRPAKPLVIAWLPDVQPGLPTRLVPVFGLPGNPVSSLVSYQVIALPVLRVLAGHAPGPPPTVPAVAAEDLRRPRDGKTHFVRVEVRWAEDGRLAVRSAGGQMSHQLTGMAGANGLAVVPDGEGFSAGESLEVILLGEVKPRHRRELTDT